MRSRILKIALWKCTGYILTMAVNLSHAAEYVYVIRSVDTTYQRDPVIQKDKFGEVVNASLIREVTVAPGKGVSDVLLETFRVSKEFAPKAYPILEDYVKRINNLKNIDTVVAGQRLLLPDLPIRAETAKLSVTNRKDAAPKLTVATVTTQEEMAIVSVPQLVNDVSNVSKTEVQIRGIPQAEMPKVDLKTGSAASTPETTRENGEYRVVNEPLTLTAHVGGENSGSFSLTDAEKLALRKYLTRPSSSNPPISPVVVILDDSFPSQEDFRHTAKFVADASDAIVRAYGLPASPGAVKSLRELTTTETSFCADCEYPNLKLHSSMIKKSLEPFVELDKPPRIEVIYLPFDIRQQFSDLVLREILRVYLLAELSGKGLILSKDGRRYPDNVERSFPNEGKAEKAIADILNDKRLGLGQVLLPVVDKTGKYNLGFNTDKAIIDGVARFLWLYSYATGRPHFLSFSWVSLHNQYPPTFHENPYGMIFAAAGNDRNMRVVSDGLMYAARGASNGDVMAVGNSSAALFPGACDYSEISTAAGIPVLGLLFPGKVSDSLCGTSFSTPRSAWVFAAREAVKGGRFPLHRTGYSEWWINRSFALKPSTIQQGDGRYAKSIWEVLEEPFPQ